MRNIVALDFDALTDRIFWSDSTTNKIYSAQANGSDTKVVITVCAQNFSFDLLRVTYGLFIYGRYM